MTAAAPAARPGRLRATSAAVAAAALGVGAGQLVALLTGPGTGPVDAVAGRVVALTPPAIAGFATVGMGLGSRATVVAGVLIVLLVAVAGAGALSGRSDRPGTGGLVVLGLLAVLAAGTGAGAGPLDVLPGIVALVAGVSVFRRLHRLAARIPAGPVLPDGRPLRESLTRRRFLRAAGLAGAGGAAAVAGAGLLAPRLPSGRIGPARDALTARLRALAAAGRIPPAPAVPAGAQFPGGTAFATPAADFYRIDTALRVPAVDPATWALRVHGMVGRELRLTLDDLLERQLVERWVTLSCVSNEVGGDLVSTTRFTGVELAPLLAAASPDPAADQLLSTSVDGWTAGSPASLVLDPAAGALLAVAMDGEALPVEHGFPVRIVVPGLYGYVSATKWVTDIEFTTFAARADYWRVRGWAPPGPTETASRIDSPGAFASLPAGRVVVTGAAWAVPRGISRVEVGVGAPEGAGWVEAELGPVPAGGATWRMWRAELDLPAGGHTIVCRATDGEGIVQTAQQRSPLPGAATGLPARPITVT
ncbi:MULTISPECIES: molybdopterin-dependent oxidoreductase [Pseudonocardia]|uniref:TMAO/DMSO reductase n=2 Tax=Pseudonocardia TaxID=1847 RepID=A0A1Y2NAJ3_PSEAH|nr:MULTISPECIES: molybdopterin-dependent oxidoreductase [Pseudonocardia]OSY44179.1 TMAO/DMSO reductase [Pseudonocardia autotrophica]TDN74091.1 DMSO/TMAO reductase YedYZ molybdopterin-dependent catalytic subunit [Pseudonocardia autotrophica]BBG04849.1 molybdopterin-binding protein [Pseudonocardia autotrophica]GEC23505.1 molybdopterin-binding protein [Pseudonocardia saturnea]